ncbi:uncharacterized protein [Nicotiana tomentosiformis]|uniref:uncharacterized protein n=1 Tax=Nicotiana tomentosiformis TaxID=4098 RepID=UPI00051C9F84|nr:uncharacterized protein LOC104120823 [Nicotiana tomentosiformis]XP_018621937.1 uncharacterized protein LOC104120823 [Nicotiana tomentosiformis]XP_033508606.1 uncharacterized protein LOC104120823 [Nicotiana tomentosiformis]
MADKQESKILLKLLVDEKKDHVVAAEAKVDFMDILVSLLTLPLGTIIRLIKAEAGVVGCMNNLYQSVENLSEEDLFIEQCKTMLLNPRNPYPKYCMRLKMHVDDSVFEKYYECSNCSKHSYFMNVVCSCEGKFTKEKFLKDSAVNTVGDEYVFLKGGISFLTTDDLQVKCASPSSLVQILSSVGLSDMKQVEEMHVEVGKNEVIHLLARSFISKTPLSDVFLPKQKQKRARVDTITMSEFGNLLPISEIGASNNAKKLELKLTLRKSTNKVLCAEAGNEFVDFLFNFLTIPLGSIEDALKGSSGLECIDNFYKSVEILDSKWFNTPPKRNSYISEENLNDNLKTMLLKPGIAPHHKSEYQLLQISEGKSEIYNLYDPRYYDFVRNSYRHKFQKFAKEPSLFYVMDNLEVRPLSSTSTICLLQELNVPMNDIEEQMISFGESEALSLLKASLTSSSSALTEGLNHNLKKQIDEDVKCNLKKLPRAG